MLFPRVFALYRSGFYIIYYKWKKTFTAQERVQTVKKRGVQHTFGSPNLPCAGAGL